MVASDGQHGTPLIDRLRHCVDRPHAPFYTPGHKRGQGIAPELRALLGAAVFQADLPELPELDNLFAPEGVLQTSQELAADAFGADRSWFLVNGSTAGLMAAILATCQTGEKIILPRNVHRSVISGLILSGAMPVFVQPEYDPILDIAHTITPAAVAAALEQHPDARAVLMVSPTYYGVCGNIAAIADLAHAHHIPLLVDEAHGAHFAFHPDLPIPALAAGADLSVQSTHKTLSAMTQAAMVHIRDQRIEPDRLTKALSLVQSTSPSYLLLASLDAARQQMATRGRELLTQTLALANQARSRLSEIPGLSLLQAEQATTPGFVSLDLTRLTVIVTALGLDGFAVDQRLHQQYGVTAELPSLRHLTFILSLGNTQADIDQLIQGFAGLAATCRDEPGLPAPPLPSPTSGTSLLSPRSAFFGVTEFLPPEQAIDRCSAELVCPYPPGIPVLMPGEKITAEAIAYLQQVLAAGGIVSGCADPTLGRLKVVQN